jgi:hypothetical protein
VGGQGLPASLLDHARVRTLPDPGSLNAAANDGIAWAAEYLVVLGRKSSGDTGC